MRFRASNCGPPQWEVTSWCILGGRRGHMWSFSIWDPAVAARVPESPPKGCCDSIIGKQHLRGHET